MALGMVLHTFIIHPFSHSLLLLLSLLFMFWIKRFRVAKSKLPPSPPKLPIIGHLHKLSALPHQSLQTLSKKYGPLMLLHLGSTPTIVVSSAKIAKEVLRTQDITFINRPVTKAAKIFMYGDKNVGFAPYGEYWRTVRKLCVQDLLSLKRVESYRYIRDEEIASMVDRIRKASSVRSEVNLSELMINVTYSIFSRICLGRAWEGEEGESEYAKLSKEVNALFGLFSFEDVFPCLGWVDTLTGIKQRMTKASKELHHFFDEIIKEKELKKVGAEDSRKDFVDLMLDFQKDRTRTIEFTHKNLRTILIDMLVAGTDTIYTTIDWAMAEVLKNPNITKRLQEEIRDAVGKKYQVDEIDIFHLDYLNCVIKETLRLHAPAALSLPRISSASAEIEGYHVPANTRTLVNLWAINRDPEMWDRADEFIPERFIDNPIDFRGNDFELIPFSAGRRGCPGVCFTTPIVASVLSNLLYWFDWETMGSTSMKDIDMTEIFGGGVRRKFPLRLVPVTCFL